MSYLAIFCHLLVGDKGRRGLETLVAKSDKDGKGLKLNDFSMILFLNGVLIKGSVEADTNI